MDTIKQKTGSKDCLACVAAMATETFPSDYIGFCQDRDLDRFSDSALVPYLHECGYGVGIFVEEGRFFEIQDLENVNILGAPAYMIVESSKEHVRKAGGTHAVYWDGERIHDPNPDADFKDGDYKILGILPIVMIENHPRWKKKSV